MLPTLLGAAVPGADRYDPGEFAAPADWAPLARLYHVGREAKPVLLSAPPPALVTAVYAPRRIAASLLASAAHPGALTLA